jgi:N-methylhydantoinase A
MRYLGQSWELHVELPASVQSVEAMREAFIDVHDRRFGHRGTGGVEAVTFRLAARGVMDKPEPPPWPSNGVVADAALGPRPVWFDGGWVDTPVYERSRLPAAAVLPGPAVIDESGSTTIVPPAWSARVLDHGDLLLERNDP